MISRIVPDDTNVTATVGGTPARGGPEAAIAIAILGVALFIPFLGSFGLWDPNEVRIAEVAREMAHGGTWLVPAHGGLKPPFLYWALTCGYRFIGGGEWAGRLPVALLSIAALLSAYYAGTGLLRRRAAFFGAIALLSSPVFFLGARQLTTLVAPILGTTLAVGGLARIGWPERATERSALLLHLGAALLGLVIGFYSCGIIIGCALPLASVALALAITRVSATTDGATDGRGPGPMPAAMVVLGLLSAAMLGAAAWAYRIVMVGGTKPGYSALLGGTPHVGNHLIQYVTLLKQVGFGAFPWIALLPLAVARAFTTLGASPPGATNAASGAGAASLARANYGRFVLIIWALFAYLAATLYAASINEVGYSAYAAIALLAGTLIDDLWDDRETATYAGLAVVVGTAVVAHDFFMAPESWAGAHVLEGIKWPAPLTLQPYFILFLGLAWALLFAGACFFRPAVHVGGEAAAPDLAAAGDAPASNIFDGRRTLLAASMGVAMIITLGATYWVVPSVSQHLSYKSLYTRYKSLVGTGDSEIGKYHVPGQLSEYGKSVELSSLPAVFDFLGKKEQVFVIAAADDLAAIDQYARSHLSETPPATGANYNYFVIDDSNAKFLMITNQIGKEPDLNPLRRLVVKVDPQNPPRPQHEAHADFEGKVEIIGYDLPSEIERGKQFKIKLYYKVNQPLGSAYKVFVHFDGPGSRFNGDHVPLEGRFPTNYWVPGYYVLDEHVMEADRSTAPAGTYQIYTGFWAGDTRLKAVSGPQDGEQRVRVGTVRVK